MPLLVPFVPVAGQTSNNVQNCSENEVHSHSQYCLECHSGSGHYGRNLSVCVYIIFSQGAKESLFKNHVNSGLAPPAAQGVILESRDRVPRQAPRTEPASPSACVSVSNK